MKNIDTYWLGRKKGGAGYYEIGISKENWDKTSGFNSHSYIAVFCPGEWEDITGMKLRQGQCVRIKRTILKNGFKFEIVN